MTETRNNIRQDWLSIPRRREEERLDPHVYKRGINGLTVEEALSRAFPRVMDILRRSEEEYSEFEQQLVRQTVRACLISQVSRANLYRIAGILVAGGVFPESRETLRNMALRKKAEKDPTQVVLNPSWAARMAAT